MQLLSMTGFGDARAEASDHSIAVEIRTINSRHLKINLRTTEGYGALDARIEGRVRQTIRRGTVGVTVRIRHLTAAEDYRLNAGLLETYLDQLQKIAAKRRLDEALRLEPLALLPGVVEQLSSDARHPEDVWPLLEPVLEAALRQLTAMREAEGAALVADLREQCRVATASLERIGVRSTEVAGGYRQRLLDRVNEALSQFPVTVAPADLIREVALFADRADISEEIVRLRSHLDQFQQAMHTDESAGRKLEFICQEMGREANTMGSKANDAEISACVVEIKTALERMREQIQNIE
jgi:uncharacterized protein (TIGR00255 family)